MSRVCVLTSGGIESSVLLAEALRRHDRVVPVYIRSHLRWEETELFWLRKFLRRLKSSRLEPLQILEVPMRDIYGKHWSVMGAGVPGFRSSDESVYLPGRNIILLSKTACLAAKLDIPFVEIGVLKGNPFSDSSDIFFRKISQVLSLGLGKEICISAPFRKRSKDEVILAGRGVPLELAFSCIHPKKYLHCGNCNKCAERKKAFFAAGVPDKTAYGR